MGTPRASPARAARLVLALCLVGCGAPTTLVGGVFDRGDIAFRVPPVPTTWRPIAISAADLVYRDDAHEASVLINGQCIPENKDAPLSSLTEHLIMGTTEREFATEETIAFDAREARHSVLRAKLDGVLMAYDIFVMKKNGCVYDLVYVGDPARMEGGVPAFEQFARGFHTIDRGKTPGRPMAGG